MSPGELEYEKPQPVYLLFLSYTISVIHDLPKIVTSLFLKCKMKKRSQKELLLLYFINYRGLTPVIATLRFRIVMLTSMYIGVLLAICALYGLIKLLHNITADKVFISENVSFLRLISWCCFGAALVTVVASFEYFPVIIISIAAAFVGLILRVVKNVMQAAVELKEENDLTI